ncbi:MAG: hypothetical protein U0359_09240 [Byssovorax sp.]
MLHTLPPNGAVDDAVPGGRGSLISAALRRQTDAVRGDGSQRRAVFSGNGPGVAPPTDPAARRAKICAALALAGHGLLLGLTAKLTPQHPSTGADIPIEVTLSRLEVMSVLPAEIASDLSAPDPSPVREPRAEPARAAAGSLSRSAGGRAATSPEAPGAPGSQQTGDAPPPAPSGTGEGWSSPEAAPEPWPGMVMALPPLPAAKAPDKVPGPLLPLAQRAPAAALAAPLASSNGPSAASAAGQAMVAVRLSAEKAAPARGRGTIKVSVNADGTIAGVTSSGVGWDAVARLIQAALAGRRLRVAPGSGGALITFAVESSTTSAPALLTGDARAEPARAIADGPMAPPTDDLHGGYATAAPNMAVIDGRALLPTTRKLVKVQLVGEQPR